MNPNDVSGKIAWILYYGMRIVVALSVPGFLYEGQWIRAASAAAIFVLMLVPALLKQQYRVYLPIQLDAAIVAFIFLTLFLGSLSNFYEMYPWWDKMLHFVSGFLLGICAFIILYVLNSKQVGRLNLNPFFVSVFVVCFSSTFSVLWEIYEFSADKLFGFNMQRDGINDTMSDLVLNLIASIIVSAIAYRWMERQKKVPFTPSRLSRFQYQGKQKHLS